MVNKMQPISTLGFGLLGLIKTYPSTGYELRSVFEETPMAHYSSSPGAIYPALYGLEASKFIRRKDGLGKTGRTIQTWHSTASGTRRLFDWLRQGVTVEDVYRKLDIVLLRFSFLDLLDDLEVSTRFLTSFRQAANDCRNNVEETMASMKSVQPLHGQLALQNGVEVFAAHAAWADKALATINQNKRSRD